MKEKGLLLWYKLEIRTRVAKADNIEITVVTEKYANYY